METPPTFIKAKKLLIYPHIAITVDTAEGGLRFRAVVLDGRPEVLTERAYVLDMVRRIYRKYLGPEGIEAPTPKRMIHSEQIIIMVTTSRSLSWDYTREVLAAIASIT